MATFSVTNLNGSGAGSLRQAIIYATFQYGDDQIVFDPSLSGGDSRLIYNDNSGVLLLENMRFSKGVRITQGNYDIGVISNTGNATLTIRNSEITDSYHHGADIDRVVSYKGTGTII